MQDAMERMTAVWGEVTDRLPPFPFTFTDYYTAEMGPSLVKSIVVFRPLISLNAMVAVKQAAMRLEDEFSVDGRRRVNIDPGYMTAAKLVLLTCKDFSHRLFLHEGVYGDVHLTVANGRFAPMPWTYPDYRQDEVLAFLDGIRRQYLAELAGKSAT